ncbi:MAG: DUF1697 domain-containing protein [Eubacteriales bacterium]
MAVYLAFLRGINVGSGNRIKMTDLWNVFQDIGFTDVQTYVQSGNVIFRSEMEDEQQIILLIEQAIQTAFGFRSTVVLRTAAEMSSIVSTVLQVSDKIAREDSSSSAFVFEYLHTALFRGIPSSGALDRLQDLKNGREAFILVGRELFLFLPDGFHSSKLAAGVQKAGLPVTIRSWKTISNLEQTVQNLPGTN